MSNRGGFLDPSMARPTVENENQRFLFIDFDNCEAEIVNKEELDQKARELYDECSESDDWNIKIFEIEGTMIEKEISVGVTVNLK